MNFNEFEIHNTTIDLNIFQEMLEKLNFVCEGGWDYERIIYDYKFQDEDNTYYLRIPAQAIHGDIGSGHALLEILTPFIGKHYYPHGLEYGDDEIIPEKIIGRCEIQLKKIKKLLTNLPNPLY